MSATALYIVSVINMFTAVQKINKNVTIKLLCWDKMPLIAVFIAEVKENMTIES